MLTDFLGVVDGHEVINAVRTTAYLANVGSPFTTGSAACSCPTLTPAMLGETDGVYTTPAADPAPWYDVDVAASADFLGALVLDVTGLDGSTSSRKVTSSIGGGAAFGIRREQPRVMTWTVLLIGSSCCGADYGLSWLEQALLACCDAGCDGSPFEMFDCCPAAAMTRPQFLTEHRRVLRRVALTSGPTVIARDSMGDTCASGGCAAGGEVLTVEFTLVSASSTLWTDTIPLLDVGLPIADDGACATWCLVGSQLPECAGGCLGAPCAADPSPDDPRCVSPAPPAVTGPEPCFCVPIGTDRDCYEIDLSTRPGWTSEVPVIVLSAGSAPLRDIKITFYEKPDNTTFTCDQIADIARCENSGSFVVTFVPAGGVLTIDGTTGQALVQYLGNCAVSNSVFGDDDGGPMVIPELSCSRYCVCIESSLVNPPAADATMTLGVSGKGR